mmetsp:Transcript_22892/g.29742  ORF Transcript_22892/g.29742 Transcript_22892/m.29742 type:complete len:245 (-) Transcript_22892:127-861(-)
MCPTTKGVNVSFRNQPVSKYATIIWGLFVIVLCSNKYCLKYAQAFNLQMNDNNSIQKSQNQNTSPALKGAVSFLTYSLNSLVKNPEELLVSKESSVAKQRNKISTTSLLKGLRKDYKNNYFLTGDISVELYDDDCTFVDPTIRFSGLSTWKTNISNLKLFFINPSIELLDIKLEKNINGIRAKWILNCGLALPWRPQICVGGSTLHSFDPAKGNRVYLHEETWDISAFEAVLQIFKPSFTGKTE